MTTFNVIEVMNETNRTEDVVSIKYSAGRIDDASLVKLTDLVAGERDLYTAIAPVDVTKDEVVIVAPADVYQMDNGMRIPITDPTMIDYPANRPLRAYRLSHGKRFKVSNTAITGVPVQGQFVVPVNAGVGMAIATDLTGATKVAFVVEETGSTCNIFVGASAIPATILRVVTSV